MGQADPVTLNRLFEARAQRTLFSQALLLHAMAVAHLPVSQLDTVANEIIPRIRVDANDAYVDEVATGFDDFLDSTTRTSALVLRALLAAQPDHPLASRLAHGLLDHREGGAWRSTQETVWALLALSDYRKAQESTPPDLDARVFLGSTLLGEGHFHGGSDVDEPFHADMRQVFPESGRPLTFDVKGNGKLYYAAELRTVSPDLPTHPRDSGMYVQKLLRALDAKELAEAQKTLPQHGESRAAPGNLVLVDLLLETAEPHDQVVIDDPLPAGLEPIDFALDTSAHEERVSDDGPHGDEKGKAMFHYGVAFRSPGALHREQHDDRVLTFLGHIEPGIYHFRYLARATTPGDFVVPPTRAACMYWPEVSGASAASHFVVGSRQTAPTGRRREDPVSPRASLEPPLVRRALRWRALRRADGGSARRLAAAADTRCPPSYASEERWAPFGSTIETGRCCARFAPRTAHARERRWTPLGEHGRRHGARGALAAEDRRFYQHAGVDPVSLVRAAFLAMSHGRVVSGASTLTMQLARTVRPHRRNVWGKLREMALAVRIEWSLSKERILEEYVNRVSFGPNLRGVAAASQAFFGKSPASLSAAEAALVAGMARGPSLYRRLRSALALTRARRDRVLGRMQRPTGWLRRRTRRRVAKKEEPIVATVTSRASFGAPHFVGSLLRGDLSAGRSRRLHRRRSRVPRGSGVARRPDDDRAQICRRVVETPGRGDRAPASREKGVTRRERRRRRQRDG